MQEVRVPSLAQENPPEKEMTIHFSILAWEISWTEEPAGYNPWGYKRDGHSLATKQRQCTYVSGACISSFLISVCDCLYCEDHNQKGQMQLKQIWTENVFTKLTQVFHFI